MAVTATWLVGNLGCYQLANCRLMNLDLNAAWGPATALEGCLKYRTTALEVSCSWVNSQAGVVVLVVLQLDGGFQWRANVSKF